MIHRIEVAEKLKFNDPRGERIAKRIKLDLGIKIGSVRTIDVYTCKGKLASQDLHVLAEELLADPVVQDYSVDEPLAKNIPFSYLIEVGKKEGVTDSEGNTSRVEAKEILKSFWSDEVKETGLEIYTSTQYLLSGKLTEEEARRVATELLANELIERFRIIKRGSWEKDRLLKPPIAELDHEPQVSTVDLNVPDETLLEISKDRLLALNFGEMKAIQEYFSGNSEGRMEKGLPSNPTDVEIEALAQSWSEHCKHKIFKALIQYENGESGTTRTIDSLFKSFIQKATEEIEREKDWLVSVFRDNAGVIKLDSDYNLTFKVETHNSPSALDPYGGAITGIVGVNRDPLGTGLGSRLFFNTNVFCFAPPDYESKPLKIRDESQEFVDVNRLPQGVKHPKRIFEGVRKGVEDGGNKSGIPTVNGTIRFDNRYLGQPLVYCGTGGIMPAQINGELTHKKKIEPGDLIVMVGGRIGKDGIHGATFSSSGLDKESPQSAVQIGDPFTQKVMADMLLEARDRGLYRTIHDNGAGGLSASVGELASISGGCELHLERAPLKYGGLDPWEILLSESQERMTLAVPEKNIDKFLELAKDRDVEATVLGKFTDSSRFHILYDGKTVAYLDLNFLLEGFPQKKLTARWQPKKFREPTFDEPAHLGKVLHQMLARLNICSKEYVIRQYDHEVQGGSIVKPLVGKANDGPSDASIIWPLEMMGKNSFAGVVVSNGINHKYGDIDTYWMAACVIDEAIRNAVAVGASLEHLALLDNFSWSSSDEPYRMAQLVRACRAIYEYSTFFGTPFISGKDSMYNDYEGEIDGEKIRLSCPPTLLISAIGKIEDINKAVTMDIKTGGDLIYIIGQTREELGGSEYYALIGEKTEDQPAIGNTVPKVNKREAKACYFALNQAMEKSLVEAAHDCSEGGLGVALAEMVIAGKLGLEIYLDQIPTLKEIKRDDFILFSESPSRLLIEVKEANQKKIEALFEGVTCDLIGETTRKKKLTIKGKNGETIISEPVSQLKESWKEPFTSEFT